jgi:hypothetical protein
MTRTQILVVTLALGLFSPALAHAQSAESKTAAEALFAEGRRLMDQGHFAEACKKLEGSQKLDPGAGTLLNLASCYEQNGQTASAWVTYKEAASSSAARHPDWAAQATARASELEPKLSKLTIVVDKAPPSLVVTRDGVSVEPTTFGVAVPVDPGSHVIEAQAPGRRPFKTEITVGATHDAQTLSVPALLEGDESPPPSAGSGQRIVAITLMGVGGAGLIIGSAFGAMALGKKGDASNPQNCTPDFKTCSLAGKALVDDAKSAGLVSTVAIIAGGAFAVGGLVLYLVAPRTEAKRVQARFGAEGAQIGVTLGGVF